MSERPDERAKLDVVGSLMLEKRFPPCDREELPDAPELEELFDP